MPARPAGCGPLKLTSRTPSTSSPGIETSGAAHTFTGPSVNRDKTLRPLAKSLSLWRIITVGSAASGLVSIAVTNIEAATEPALGTFEKGRVLKATHCPDSTN